MIELSKKRVNSKPKLSAQNQFKIFPNPTKSNFIVESPNVNTRWSVTITNMDGRELNSCKINLGEPAISIESDKLSSGIYLVVLQNLNGTEKITSKLIVDHP